MTCQVKDCDGDVHVTVRHRVTGEELEVCMRCAEELTADNPDRGYEVQSMDMA